MWDNVARLIIRYRLLLIVLITIITGVMAYYATKVQMSYDFARTVPLNDPDMIMLQKFREQFGEDGNIIAIGFKDSAIYQQRNFEAYRDFARTAKQISGVSEVIALRQAKVRRRPYSSLLRMRKPWALPSNFMRSFHWASVTSFRKRWPAG